MASIGAVLVAAAFAVSSPAFGDSPERSGAFTTPGPQTITGTPSANLVAGQGVKVSGANFPPSAVVELSQCAVPTGPEAPVCTVLVGPEVRTGPDGSFGPLEGVPVAEQAKSGDGARVMTCALPRANCYMVATTGDPFQIGEPGEAGAGHELFIGSAGPVPPTDVDPGAVTPSTAPPTTPPVVSGTAPAAPGVPRPVARLALTGPTTDRLMVMGVALFVLGALMVVSTRRRPERAAGR